MSLLVYNTNVFNIATDSFFAGSGGKIGLVIKELMADVGLEAGLLGTAIICAVW